MLLRVADDGDALAALNSLSVELLLAKIFDLIEFQDLVHAILFFKLF